MEVHVTKLEGSSLLKMPAENQTIFQLCMFVFILDLSSSPGCSYVLPEGKFPSHIKLMRAAHKLPLPIKKFIMMT